MRKYSEQKFTGERALFQSRDLEIDSCTFGDGESPLKESKNIKVRSSQFQWKYPFWYCRNVEVEDSAWFEMARAGVWYTNHIKVKNSLIQAPKNFRRCDDLILENVDMPNAGETLWNCSNVVMKQVTAKGDYFGMGSVDMELENFSLIGNYSFDGVKNVTVRNAKMISKDAFWNAENVTVYDSYISGEYLGWNSKNVTLINCTIDSEQGMCYMENVVMKNCRLLNTNLAFEYSTVNAEINSSIDSVKNPVAGIIKAKNIGEIVFDNEDMKQADTTIIMKNGKIAIAG